MNLTQPKRVGGWGWVGGEVDEDGGGSEKDEEGGRTRKELQERRAKALLARPRVF